MGGKTEIQQAPTTPAPSASESAADIYQARLKYDPLVAQQEMDIQRAMLPQQTALYSSLYNQYYPELAMQQRNLQESLYPQQSRILEAGATQALQQLQVPENPLLQSLGQQAQAGLTQSGYTPQQQAAIDAIRQKQSAELSRSLRERSNLGGTLYGGRSQQLESQGLQELGQRFAAEDIDRMTAQRQQALATASGVAGQQMQARQLAQTALNPYMQILYPQIGTQNPNISAYQFQSAVPSADNLYNAMFQASQPQMFATQSPDRLGQGMQLAGSLGGAALTGAIIA